MEIKYTNDGKKVSVVGKLNSREYIVQEIFVSNGNEIPSGENFVVKNLHDSPAKSWKELELDKLDKSYNTIRQKYDHQIEELHKKSKDSIANLKEIISFNTSLANEFNSNVFDTLNNFLNRKITHVLIDGYNLYDIKEFADVSLCEYYKDKLKLITLYGNTNGNLNWDLCKYSSGSNNYNIYPCTSYDDAINKLKDLITEKMDDRDIIRDKIFFADEKYNLNIIPKEKLIEYHNGKINYMINDIVKCENMIKDKKEKIETYKQKYNLGE